MSSEFELEDKHRLRSTRAKHRRGARLARAAAGACVVAAALAPASAFAARLPVGHVISIFKNGVTAGYVSEHRGISSLSTTFEVPEILSCVAGAYAGMGPVVALLGPGYFVGAGAEAECQNGVTSYLIAINHDGSESHPLTIAPKDLATVNVAIGPKAVSIVIDDLTSKQRTSQMVVKGKVTSAEIGDDSLYQGKHEVPIPRFTDHQFTNSRINGRVLSMATPLLDYELVNGNTLLIEPGALSKAGDSFVMHFVHAT